MDHNLASVPEEKKKSNLKFYLLILGPLLILLAFLIALIYFRVIDISLILPAEEAIVQEKMNEDRPAENTYTLSVNPYSDAVSDALIYYTFPRVSIDEVTVVSSSTGDIQFKNPAVDLTLPRVNIDEQTRISIGSETSSVPGSVTNLKPGDTVRAVIMFNLKSQKWRAESIYRLLQ